jgi:hypothetical protein
MLPRKVWQSQNAFRFRSFLEQETCSFHPFGGVVIGAVYVLFVAHRIFPAGKRT